MTQKSKNKSQTNQPGFNNKKKEEEKHKTALLKHVGDKGPSLTPLSSEHK